MDFDGDGQFDLISGSYDPGEIYLFRGLGSGKFKAREVIKDKSGKPILKSPNQQDSVESFGSWVTTVDWDDDGDLDVLVGTFDGMIFLRRNEGTRAAPAYAISNEWVKVGDKKLRVPGGEHATPVIADWDGDGRWDLLTGSANGGVYCYRNQGGPGRPDFGRPTTLVPKHEGIGYSELLDAGAKPRPGIRSQIAVVDYNDDGKLDLLVGDFCTYLHVRKTLTAEARKEFQTLKDQQDKIVGELRGGMEAIRASFKESMKGAPQSEWNSPENTAKWDKLYKGMRESPAYKKNMAEHERLKKEIVKYVEADESGIDAPAKAHGFVWLFRRKK